MNTNSYTDPAGQTHTRNSKARAYTHVVVETVSREREVAQALSDREYAVAHGETANLDYHDFKVAQAEALPETSYRVVSWHANEALAHKAAAKWSQFPVRVDSI